MTKTSKEFIVDKSEVRFSDKAIYLPVKRKSDGVIVDHRWFPLSQIKYEEMINDYKVIIPNWLYKKNVGNGFTIGC